jgi:hypothetical protein
MIYPEVATLTVRSDLLPISMMVMLGFACCLASSSQLAKWLKVSLLRHNKSSGCEGWAVCNDACTALRRQRQCSTLHTW